MCICGHLVAGGVVCICRQQRKAEVEARRPSARERGYDTKWERESKAFLAKPENHRCACGCGQPAEMVDHRIAHKGDQRLFWNRANWHPMTKRCNSRKAARDEGGFGNPIRGAIADFPAGGHGPHGGRSSGRAHLRNGNFQP